MADKIAKYNLKRLTAYNRLKETHEIGLLVANDDSQKALFLTRVDSIDKIYEEFQSHHNVIVGLISEDEFKAYETMRISADQAFYGAKAIKHQVLQSDATVNQSNVSLNVANPSQLKAKLPKINLPKFDGDFKKWSGFIDLFNSLIHHSNELSNIEKFQYLLTSVEKEPLNLIQGLPVTDGNYVVAYETIEKRYQNKRLLASYHYNELQQVCTAQRGTANELRSIVNAFSENLAALRALKFPVDQWDFLLFNMLLHKLDIKSRTDFELQNFSELPTYLELKYFVDNKCKALESVHLMSPPNNQNFKSKPVSSPINNKPCSYKNSFPALMAATDHANDPMGVAFKTDMIKKNQKTAKCVLCSSSHALYKCFSFISKSPSDRFSFAKQHTLCINCLCSSHSTRKCPSSSKCRVCGAPHHTLLHFESSPPNKPPLNPSHAHLVATNEDPAVSAMTSTINTLQSTVLLSTALVAVKDARGNFQKVRILFDTGSMANFISERCVNRLGLQRHRSSIPIEGLNGMSTQLTSGIAHCAIKPLFQKEPILSFDAIILPKICSDQPKINVHYSQWLHIRNLKLADDSFNVPGPIDILIGPKLVPLCLGPGRVAGQLSQPVALETIFGYILQGRAENSAVSPSALLSCHVALDEDLHFQLQKFWEVDQVPKAPTLSVEDKNCEAIYQTHTFRVTSGRFHVPLPFKFPNPTFGDTYQTVYRLFRTLESRLAKNPALQKFYAVFMQDYLDSGHMAIVPSSECKSSKAYYIPHHCVFKQEMAGPKLRVVFNASFRGSNGRSLNDSLLVGPKLQRDISTILLSFRFYSYVFICDIKQMYRQIRIQSEFHDFQRILWRFSADEPIKEYYLSTVTYGVTSAPFLALRSLQELATQGKSRYPMACKVVNRDIYIDDVVTGQNELESALRLQNELQNLMKSGGFELRKWASNDPAILANIPTLDVQASFNFDTEEQSFIKVLGLKWCPQSDIFSYSFTPMDRPCTKRNILSEISRIFDPSGFISPIVLLAKCLLQKLWASKISWDETPTNDIMHIWNKYKSELPQLAEIQIPRQVVPNHVQSVELHGFCDASQVGYAGGIYFRTTDTCGHSKVFLVTAKCKVAPLKTISVPRLELCAAVLLADLIFFVQTVYSDTISFNAIYAWSDSCVVLAWLNTSPHRWKTFVANRVSHIQDQVSPKCWHYVPSSENPADCASRGMTPGQLLGHPLWWFGPSFLDQAPESWPRQPVPDWSESVTSEEKQLNLHLTVKEIHFIDNLLSRYSSLPKIQRVMAYVLRFVTKSEGHSTAVSIRANCIKH